MYSRLIHWATSDPYTHVSISLDRDLTKLYSFARRYQYTPLPAGLVREELCRGYFSHHGDIDCILYRLDVKDEVYNNLVKRIDEMMQNSEEYKYSVLGVLLCKLDIAHERGCHYFCSQFVGEILKQSGALDLPKPSSLMRPYDYSKLKQLVPEYHGALRGLAHGVPPDVQKGYCYART